MQDNITYRTDELVRYFSHNRIKWAQFYESERVIIAGLGLDREQTVLDIGCGCGGLGLALREQFGVENYTGVEINERAAHLGRELNPQARLLCGDILDLSPNELSGAQFSHVFSLSCIDWNVRFRDMLQAAWGHVRPGGCFVATFRLTDGEGCSDMSRSYQYINYEGVRSGELAAYIVLNAGSLCDTLLEFDPAAVAAFGYWGAPSSVAVTPYARLCFAALSIRKRGEGDTLPIRFDLNLPTEIRQAFRTP